MPFISDSGGTTLLFSVWRQSWAQLSHLRLCWHFYTVCLIAAAFLSRKSGKCGGSGFAPWVTGQVPSGQAKCRVSAKSCFYGKYGTWQLFRLEAPSRTWGQVHPGVWVLLSTPWKVRLERFTPFRSGVCLPQSLLNLPAVPWAPACFCLFLLPLLVNIFERFQVFPLRELARKE